jgi:Uma2 family endonuclease
MTAVSSEPQVAQQVLDLLDELGLRYECIDGSLVVNPPATFGHGELVVSVAAQLYAAAPPDLVVLDGSYGYYYDGSSWLLPDVTVARRADCRERGLHAPPLLVVEVLSPSTRRRDRGDKQAIYAESGVPSYWVVDPVARTLTVLELQGGAYAEAARASGGEPLAVTRPFPVEVRLPG